MSTRSEVISRVTRHVAARFGGDFQAAFSFYDDDRDGRITKQELLTLLMRSGIDWFRSRIADGVITELDTDEDGSVGWAEFEKVFKQQ